MRLIDADTFDKCLLGAEIEATKSQKYVFSSAINTIRGNLANFPTVNQWIPVSERLPKKDGRYQVTRYDYVTNTEFIEILWYEENIWWNRRSMGDYAVTAWMPLPEPYKAESEEA